MRLIILLLIVFAGCFAYVPESPFFYGYLASDPYYFGTQNLFCVVLSASMSASRRFEYAWSHRLIKYKNRVFEWGVNGFNTGRRPLTRVCPVTWEERPAGYSFCSRRQTRSFGRDYMSVYGDYGVLTNNCHMFANRLSAFLTAECRS